MANRDPDTEGESVERCVSNLVQIAEAKAHVADGLTALRSAMSGYIALVGDPDTSWYDPAGAPVFDFLSRGLSDVVHGEQQLLRFEQMWHNRFNAAMDKET